MPVYKVKVWYATHVTSEVEAKDAEEAIYKAVCDGIRTADVPQALENIEALEYDNEATLADCQYTSHQELKDRERDL